MADWQTLDPEAAREAEKYENPIPSRELILQHLAERGSPAAREQLVEEFGLTTEDQIEALRRRLRAMERDAQLIYTRRGTYAPVDKLDLILGRISGHRDGFGFLIPDDGSDDLFMSPSQMRLVFDGDRALARVSGLDRRGRREGVIVEVVSRAHETIVGRYFEEGGIGFVVADNPKIQQEVLVTPGRNAGAKVGQFVEVKITHWPTPRFQPQGDVLEVVGNYMAPGMEIDIALRTYDIPHVWPEAVLKEAAKLKPEVEEKDKEKRIDLRHLPFVTIDGEDARDFDDAVYCEARPGKLRLFSGGWTLYVAIADVSSYVKIGSALDAESQVRGNSVYFPERVIPMLPEQLSNGLCSLNPKVSLISNSCSPYRLLTWWDGQGAARVFASAAGALLMERASGAGDLAQIAWSGQDDEACRIYLICARQNVKTAALDLARERQAHEAGARTRATAHERTPQQERQKAAREAERGREAWTLGQGMKKPVAGCYGRLTRWKGGGDVVYMALL